MLGRRTNGAHPVHRLREEMDRLFQDFTGEMPTWNPTGWFGAPAYPALNVWEDQDALYAEAEMPGMSMDDVEVFVVGNELTIKGERRPVQEENVAYHRRERATGVFSRTVNLPMQIDADKVEGTFKDGVLTVRMPKAEAAKPRKIKVQTA